MKLKAKQSTNLSDYYKPLLVEEIVLVSKPTLMICGRCSVIGKLADSENKLWSLCISCFPSKMQLRDCTYSVKLDLSNYTGLLPRGKHVEIHGIVFSTEETDGAENDFEYETASQVTLVHDQFVTFILVENMYEVVDAMELIVCNLRIRKLKLFSHLR